MSFITKIRYCVGLALCEGGLAILIPEVTKKHGTLGTLELTLIIKELAGTLHGTLRNIAWLLRRLPPVLPLTNQTD